MTKTEQFECSLCDFVTHDKSILSKHIVVAMGHRINILCRYFINGFCKAGVRCNFIHKQQSNLNLLSSAYSPSYSQVVNNGYNRYTRNSLFNNQKKNVQCRFYDRCYKYPNCNFAHNEICKFQQNCQNIYCRFVHLNESNQVQYHPFLDKNFLGVNANWRFPLVQ